MSADADVIIVSDVKRPSLACGGCSDWTRVESEEIVTSPDR